MSANLTSQRPNKTNTTELLRPTGPGYGILWSQVTGETGDQPDLSPPATPYTGWPATPHSG